MNSDYTVRKGQVLLADGTKVVVRVDKAGDEPCDSCHVCPMKALCKGMDVRHMDLPVPAPEGRTYAPGDSVTLAYRQANEAVAALVMFAPALIGLALGGWAGWKIGEGGNAALLIGCAAGFAAGVGASWTLARKADCLRPDVRILAGEG